MKRTSLLALLCVLPVIVTACGGGGNKASASSSTATTTPANGSGSNSAFTKCLSEHGVTLPSGGFNGPGGGGGEGGPPNGSLPAGASGPPQGGFPGGAGGDSKTQQAFSACRSKLPNGGRGGGFGGQNSQAFQAYTSCLKDHGVTLPTGASGASGAGGPGALGNLQSDPKYVAANKTCQALLPNRTGGGNTTTTVGG